MTNPISIGEMPRKGCGFALLWSDYRQLGRLGKQVGRFSKVGYSAFRGEIRITEDF